MTNWESHLRDVKGKRVAFIGLGVSHRELAAQYIGYGARVTVLDRAARDTLGPAADEIEAHGGAIVTGGGYLDHLRDFDIVFRTPGQKYLDPKIQDAVQAGVCVTSEIETFFGCCPCPITAVTGSDGKTTTTTLIATILRKAGQRVHLGGNIGTPLLPRIADIQPGDCAVVELSSFQLISMRTSPHVAVVTNVAPNHLDVHADMDEYVSAKMNILRYQSAADEAVLGWDNEVCRDTFAPLVRGTLRTFSLEGPVERGAYLSAEGMLTRVESGVDTPLFHKDAIRIPGIHNVANFLAAIAAVGPQIDPAVIERVAREFPGVEHRIEFVRERGCVRWYNDSIATSPTRAIAGLRSFPRKVIQIAGGYDKHLSFTPLAPVIVDKVAMLIVMGATGPAIEQAVRKERGFTASGLVIEHAGTMEEAVAIADRRAHDGDDVILCPASASFDLYKNFELRGEHFKRLVNELD